MKEIEDVSIFISVTQVGDINKLHWMEIKKLDVTYEGDLTQAITDVILNVKNRAQLEGGCIDKILVTILNSFNSGFYVKPKDFNYLLKL